MNEKLDHLIKDLTDKHQAKPFWKGYHFLLALWFFLNLSIFFLETIKSSNLVFSSSTILLGLNIIAAGLSWFFFSLNLNRTFAQKWDWLFLTSLVTLVIAGLNLDYFSGLILYQRPFSFQSADVSCFNHIVLSTIPTAIIFLYFIKNFFVARPLWTIAFLTGHVSLLAITVMELKCHNKEFWHLLIGHQTTYFAIFMIFLSLWALKQKRASLAA